MTREIRRFFYRMPLKMLSFLMVCAFLFCGCVEPAEDASQTSKEPKTVSSAQETESNTEVESQKAESQPKESVPEKSVAESHAAQKETSDIVSKTEKTSSAAVSKTESSAVETKTVSAVSSVVSTQSEAKTQSEQPKTSSVISSQSVSSKAAEVSKTEVKEEPSKAPESSIAPESVSPEHKEDLVWIPTNGGKKYHCSEKCSNMIDPEQVTVEEALAGGFTKCKRCYK